MRERVKGVKGMKGGWRGKDITFLVRMSKALLQAVQYFAESSEDQWERLILGEGEGGGEGEGEGPSKTN